MDKSTRGFLAFSSFLIAVFLMALNFLVFPGSDWSFYTAILFLAPVLFFLLDGSRHFKLFSVVGSILVLIVLAAANLRETPDYLWVLFAVPAVLAWPLVILMGQRAASFFYSTLASLVLVLSYVLLNIYFEPGFPFSIFTTFAIMWWPLSVGIGYFPRAFSIVAAAWLILFFIVANAVTTDAIWWIYPAFASLFWPLSVLLARHLLTYSIISTILISIFFIVVNVITSKETIWAIYPIFAVLWWPLSIYFFVYRRKQTKQKFI